MTPVRTPDAEKACGETITLDVPVAVSGSAGALPGATTLALRCDRARHPGERWHSIVVVLHERDTGNDVPVSIDWQGDR